MAMKLTDINEADVAYVCRNIRREDARELNATRWSDEPDDLLAEVLKWGKLAWVAKHNDEPVAVFGAVEIHPRCWSAWLFATDKINFIGFSLTRFIIKAMIPAIRNLGGHRCDACTIEGHDQAHKWLELLGAKREATLTKYGKNGETFFIYRWL